MGDAVGKLYAARYFAAGEKARAETMVHNLMAAFSQRIDGLSWMAPETKAKAKAKLAVLKIGVGYPDHWIDYSALKVVPGDALGNARRAESFETARNLAKLGKPVDRSEWVMPSRLSVARSWGCAPTTSTSDHNERSRRSALRRTVSFAITILGATGRFATA